MTGDEIVGINNVSVKGRTKVEVAKMIQAEKVCSNFKSLQKPCSMFWISILKRKK